MWAARLAGTHRPIARNADQFPAASESLARRECSASLRPGRSEWRPDSIVLRETRSGLLESDAFRHGTGEMASASRRLHSPPRWSSFGRPAGQHPVRARTCSSAPTPSRSGWGRPWRPTQVDVAVVRPPPCRRHRPTGPTSALAPAARDSRAWARSRPLAFGRELHSSLVGPPALVRAWLLGGTAWTSVVQRTDARFRFRPVRNRLRGVPRDPARGGCGRDGPRAQVCGEPTTHGCPVYVRHKYRRTSPLRLDRG